MSNIFKVNCNGIRLGCHFLNYLKPIIIPHIAGLRRRFKFGERMYDGIRFSSDDAVFQRISSALFAANIEPASLTQEEINHLINSALTDCAKADYWYRFEKDYD